MMKKKLGRVSQFLAGAVVGFVIYGFLDLFGPIGALGSALVCGALIAVLVIRAR